MCTDLLLRHRHACFLANWHWNLFRPSEQYRKGPVPGTDCVSRPCLIDACFSIFQTSFGELTDKSSSVRQSVKKCGTLAHLPESGEAICHCRLKKSVPLPTLPDCWMCVCAKAIYIFFSAKSKHTSATAGNYFHQILTECNWKINVLYVIVKITRFWVKNKYPVLLLLLLVMLLKTTKASVQF